MKKICLVLSIIGCLVCFTGCKNTTDLNGSNDMNNEQTNEIIKQENEVEAIESDEEVNNLDKKQDNLSDKYYDGENSLVSANKNKINFSGDSYFRINENDYRIYLSYANPVIDAGDGFILTFDYAINIEANTEKHILKKGMYSINLDGYYDENLLMKYYMNDELSVDKIEINSIDFGFGVLKIKDSITDEEYFCINVSRDDSEEIEIFNEKFESIFKDIASNYVATSIYDGISCEENSIEFYEDRILYVKGEYLGYDDSGENVKAKFACYSLKIENSKINKIELDSIIKEEPYSY